MSKPKELDVPLLLAVGTACTLAGILISKSVASFPPPPPPPPPRSPDPPDLHDLASPVSPRRRSRTLSYGSLAGGGEQSVQLVVSEGASRNTVEALIAELAKLQAGSADIKLSGTGAFADVAALAHKTEMDMPKRGGEGGPSGALNIDKLRAKMTLRDAASGGQLRAKRVLVRVDYNCPTDDMTQTITDTARIDTTVPSIEAIFEGGAHCVVLIAHRGRPGGAYSRANFTLEPCVAVLQEHFPDRPVKFLSECVGPSIEAATRECAPGTILLLENLRFHFEECGSGLNPHGDKVKPTAAEVKAFKQALARLGDVFVFEGFGAAHRPHASIVGCAEPGSCIPVRVSGLLVEKEISVFADVLSSPRRPFLAIVGGSKVTDKIAVLENLLGLVDVLFIGGAMAYTFKKVMGELEIGGSLFDADGAEMVADVLSKAKARHVKVLLPTDHVVAESFSDKARTGLVTDADGVPPGWLALDLGPASRACLAHEVGQAQTVLWNGPLGVCELGAFSGGTLHVMASLADATRRGATTVLGGGDTGAAARRFCVGGVACADLVTHSSTGGGTSLVLMEGKELPAVTALTDRP